MATPSDHAIRQYATTTDNLTARMAIHAYSTNPQTWFSWLGERLPVEGDVLEVGAGTGELWTHVDSRNARLTLTDFSPAMCERLRAIDRATVVRCNAIDLPFPDESFDCVIANHMLYHVDDPDAALREFARVLRPGGKVAIATNGADHLAGLNSIGPAIGRPDVTIGSAQNGFTAQTGPALVAHHFTEVTVERYHSDLEIPTPEPVLAYLQSLADEPLTSDERAAAREIVKAEIDAHGQYHAGKHTVLITARATRRQSNVDTS